MDQNNPPKKSADSFDGWTSRELADLLNERLEKSGLRTRVTVPTEQPDTETYTVTFSNRRPPPPKKPTE
jgi:hypothetical protein